MNQRKALEIMRVNVKLREKIKKKAFMGEVKTFQSLCLLSGVHFEIIGH